MLNVDFLDLLCNTQYEPAETIKYFWTLNFNPKTFLGFPQVIFNTNVSNNIVLFVFVYFALSIYFSENNILNFGATLIIFASMGT